MPSGCYSRVRSMRTEERVLTLGISLTILTHILPRMAIRRCMALRRAQRISSRQNRSVRLTSLTVPCITLKELFSKVARMLPACSKGSTHVSPHKVLIRILSTTEALRLGAGRNFVLANPKARYQTGGRYENAVSNVHFQDPPINCRRGTGGRRGPRLCAGHPAGSTR